MSTPTAEQRGAGFEADENEVPPGWVTYTVTDEDGCSGEAACVRREVSVASRADAVTIHNIELQAGRRECVDLLTAAGFPEAAYMLKGVIGEMQAWVDSRRGVRPAEKREEPAP